jgi:protein SCO1/2
MPVRLSLRLALLASLAFFAGCSRHAPAPQGAIDITGAFPPLQFTATRANDGRTVSATDYQGKVALLYFGYTHCPDVCPTTLTDLANVLKALGGDAKNVRVLFVTVDPHRDTLPVMKAYVSTFAPQIDGLRGNDNQVARMARRYRVLYRVTPGSPGHPYEVVHANTVYIFGPSGRARLVAESTGDTKGLAADIEHLLRG